MVIIVVSILLKKKEKKKKYRKLAFAMCVNECFGMILINEGSNIIQKKKKKKKSGKTQTTRC